MKIAHRILTTRFLIPIFTFSIGCFLTNVFTNLSCSDSKSSFAASPKYLLVILILSAPENVDRRNAIRETWLNLRPHHNNADSAHFYIPRYDDSGFLRQETIDDQKTSLQMHRNWLKTKQFTDQLSAVKIIHKFAIGVSGLTTTRHKELLKESKSYNDLLLLNGFQDSYKNLSKKLVLSLKSISGSFSFNYLLKCDDDTYVKLDIMLTYLMEYHSKVNSIDFSPNPAPELYWGYFNGRANIKTQGQWKEANFNLCSKYLPYALGGGYIISERLVRYVDTNSDILNLYVSEDISAGIWFASLRNVFRKHDCRFDTAYMARTCKDYYFVLHKRSAEDMRLIFKGVDCDTSLRDNNVKRPLEYFYDWKTTSTQCCDTLVN